jgi:hypothetical protein
MLKTNLGALGFTSDSHGYMLTYRSRPIGGAGTMRKGGARNGAMKAADMRMHRESAERDIAELRAGRGEARYREAMTRIDAELDKEHA